jgi:[acyl-carrier-protein] S-malonyltransferase
MKKKIALMFPGQGSQFIGMGKDLYDVYSKARKIIDSSGDVIKNLMFGFNNDNLKLTKYAQPAIFTVSIAAFEVFKDMIDISKFEFVAAGHSLGEYSALCAAGVFDFENGLSIVNTRASFFQKASEENKGIMAAIIGIDEDIVKNICEESSKYGICEIANLNLKNQIVISGSIEAVNKAVLIAKKNKSAKIVFLNVSGAFHSSLMKSASCGMENELYKYNFEKPLFGIYMNYDALLTEDIKLIKTKLVKQITNPVKWNQIIENIILLDFDIFIEIGPGKVLSNLLKKIDCSKKIYNIENSASLLKTLEDLVKYEAIQ